MPSKRQLGPRVDSELADQYEWFVRHRNEGMYKGRLGEEIEQAMRLQMAVHFSVYPEQIEQIQDAAALKELRRDIEAVSEELTRAAKNLDITISRIEQELPEPEVDRVDGGLAGGGFDTEEEGKTDPIEEAAREAGLMQGEGPGTPASGKSQSGTEDFDRRIERTEYTHQRLDKLEKIIEQLANLEVEKAQQSEQASK